MRNFSIRNTKWENCGHELDALGNRVIETQKQFYLLGLEDEIIDFNKKFSGKINIVGAICNADLKKKSDINFILLADAFKEISPDKDTIICVSHAREDYDLNFSTWSKCDYIENVNFFQSDLFRGLFFLYKYQKLHIDRIEVFATSHCTLNCEKCIAYMPYFKQRNHAPLEILIKDLDILFSQVDYVNKLKIIGGETLLYPHLVEYIEYLFAHYSHCVGTVRIGTNATLLPSSEVLDICRKYGVIMDVSDYAIPDLCRLSEVLELLNTEGVGYSVKRTGEQWLDMGFPNNPATYRDELDVIEHFHKCAMFCREFYDGKLYFCCSNFAAVAASLFPENSNDYLDFRETHSKEKILEFEFGFSSLGHTTFCSHCRGCSIEANSMSVPVAKQVKVCNA